MLLFISLLSSSRKGSFQASLKLKLPVGSETGTNPLQNTFHHRFQSTFRDTQ